MELKGEDLWSCSHKIIPVSLRKCPNDHWLTNKAYLSAITVTIIFRSFTYKMAAKTGWHRYGTKSRHCHPMYCRPIGTLSFPRANWTAKRKWTRAGRRWRSGGRAGGGDSACTGASEADRVAASCRPPGGRGSPSVAPSPRRCGEPGTDAAGAPSRPRSTTSDVLLHHRRRRRSATFSTFSSPAGSHCHCTRHKVR